VYDIFSWFLSTIITVAPKCKEIPGKFFSVRTRHVTCHPNRVELVQVDVRFFFVESLNSIEGSSGNNSVSSDEGRWWSNDITVLQEYHFPPVQAVPVARETESASQMSSVSQPRFQRSRAQYFLSGLILQFTIVETR
jgi:hypothetical protein